MLETKAEANTEGDPCTHERQGIIEALDAVFAHSPTAV